MKKKGEALSRSANEMRRNLALRDPLFSGYINHIGIKNEKKIEKNEKNSFLLARYIV